MVCASASAYSIEYIVHVCTCVVCEYIWTRVLVLVQYIHVCVGVLVDSVLVTVGREVGELQGFFGAIVQEDWQAFEGTICTCTCTLHTVYGQVL